MRAEPDRPPEQTGSSRACGDLELARAIASGSIEAWHEFLEKYSNLVYGVARRHLFAEDDEDVRTVCVDILKALYDGDLAKFTGEASLVTWLVVYTRNRSYDFMRRRYGRRRPPKWFELLGELDRDVLKFYFAERLPLEAVVHALAWSGHTVSVEGVVESILRIEAVADAKYMAWIDSETRARAIGIRSPQMMVCMMNLRLDYEERSKGFRPDAALAEAEAAAAAERIRSALERLTPEEREIVSRRFERRQTAEEISEEMHLGGQRRSYTVIDRAVRKLRRMVMSEGE
jgi:RNA polymerase sigma factor (sigma-70 family)